MAKSEPLKLMINGFGRIGRVLTRQLLNCPDIKVVAINDLVQDIDNLAYLYNYDSHYGRATHPAVVREDKKQISIGNESIAVYAEKSLKDIPWKSLGIGCVIDATGVHQNIIDMRDLVNAGSIMHGIVTHAPKKDVDIHVIMGVNDEALDAAKHKVIAASICDANALSHPLKVIEESFGIEYGFVTTLHPWLSYQNLVDGPTVSQSNPAHFWKDYSLGRASTGALIPKETTAITALDFVLPGISKTVTGFSYRIPTHIVCSADMTLTLRKDVSVKDVHALFENTFRNSKYVALNSESLISKDYEAREESCVIDLQWTRVVGGRTLKIVCWYDNEWGYSARVKDLVRRLSEAA